MPFFFADGGRSVEEANTSFGYARPRAAGLGQG